MIKTLGFVILTQFFTGRAYSQELTTVGQDAYGIKLSVEKGSVYEKAGFKTGDIVVGVNDERIRDRESGLKFLENIASKQGSLRFIVFRRGKEIIVEVLIK